LQGNKITRTKERISTLSRIITTTSITTMLFLALVSAYPTSLFLQSQQAEAAAYGLQRVPPAYIVVDGKASPLQFENGDPISGDGTADYSRPAQGTISFGERFSFFVPQVPGVFKDVQTSSLVVCGDEVCNDDFHIRQELVNTRDTRFLYSQTYAINAPNGVGDGFTPSDVGFKVFLIWTVGFADETEQTYLAIVHLKGDSCEDHGWVYSRSGTTCVDPNE
jgi:hypothetical protein